jgi:1-acyl-sn-glycerol-3-phosphate acyltransferase
MIETTFALGSRLLCGASAQWHCDPRAECPRIYFANHSSHLDFLVIWSALPARLRRSVRPVAGSDYWAQGAVRRYLADRVFHAVLIPRANPGSGDAMAIAEASVRRLADAIGDRQSLIVFPEGTRRSAVEIGPFKSGLYHLSRLRPDVQLIPVYLENLNRILPKGEILPVPMLSRVVFGPPLTDVCEDKPLFLARAREALIQVRTIP